ncbi:restriction endonuclease subunit S [Campylobacter upsaliensis]|uniref:restriction endonuclease subunit S n=1 Tax=Campylobacter upsaliensis TaxID=28080 RepID=UPI0022EB86DD|nr:restriction endonuclease subunit S [Campylobacter upsaliensis]
MKKHTQSPYESSKVSYKPSGIEWLVEIPQSWEIKPLQAIFNQRNEQNNNLEFQTILSLVKDVGVIPYEEKGNVGNKAKDDLQGYKIARVNDLVLNKMNAVIGSLGVSKYDGLVSPIYLVLYIENPNYLIAYYSYLFQTKSIQKFLRKFAYGIMEIRESIDYLEFKKMFLPTPPLQEQKEIAEFLDKKCEKIQNYINKKQKLITLLQEKKQALINEAVCGRVACHTERSEVSTTAYKPSGIEYLGLIPHHWEVRRMKFMASIHNGREQTEIADENGIYPIYGSGGILGKSMYFIYDKPSVLLGRKGTIDKPLFVEEPFWTIDTMFYTSVSKIVLPKYFYYLCLTIDFQFYISGSAIPSMTQYDLANISFALPPLQEQKQIANFLDKKCEKINSVIEKTKKQIELIKEYKNTLINEAVCGRINLERK